MSDKQHFQGAPEALAALRPVLEDMPPDQVHSLRASVPQVVGHLLRIARSYAEDREHFVRVFTRQGFDPARYDDMEQRALALWQADVDYRLVLDPEKTVAELMAEAAPLRKKLLRAAIYLWEEDPELGPQVAAIIDGRGHRDTADDLIALPTLFESQWPGASSRCAVTLDDLTAARRLGLDIMHRLEPSAQKDATARARDLRDRAAAHALGGARTIRLAAAFVFRNKPHRLADYPNPLTPPTARRSPARPAEPTPDAESSAGPTAPPATNA